MDPLFGCSSRNALRSASLEATSARLAVAVWGSLAAAPDLAAGSAVAAALGHLPSAVAVVRRFDSPCIKDDGLGGAGESAGLGDDPGDALGEGLGDAGSGEGERRGEGEGEGGSPACGLELGDGLKGGLELGLGDGETEALGEGLGDAVGMGEAEGEGGAAAPRMMRKLARFWNTGVPGLVVLIISKQASPFSPGGVAARLSLPSPMPCIVCCVRVCVCNNTAAEGKVHKPQADAMVMPCIVCCVRVCVQCATGASSKPSANASEASKNSAGRPDRKHQTLSAWGLSGTT